MKVNEKIHVTSYDTYLDAGHDAVVKIFSILPVEGLSFSQKGKQVGCACVVTTSKNSSKRKQKSLKFCPQ